MPVYGLAHSMVAPVFVIAAMALLCLTPHAIPLLHALLLYWYREKRAGRTVMFRWGLGNEPDPEPAVPPESTGEPQGDSHDRANLLEAYQELAH